jgi:hypothetical protein
VDQAGEVLKLAVLVTGMSNALTDLGLFPSSAYRRPLSQVCHMLEVVDTMLGWL